MRFIPMNMFYSYNSFFGHCSKCQINCEKELKKKKGGHNWRSERKPVSSLLPLLLCIHVIFQNVWRVMGLIMARLFKTLLILQFQFFLSTSLRLTPLNLQSPHPPACSLISWTLCGTHSRKAHPWVLVNRTTNKWHRLRDPLREGENVTPDTQVGPPSRARLHVWLHTQQ